MVSHHIQQTVSQNVQHAVVVSHPIDSVPVVCIAEHPSTVSQQLSQNIAQAVVSQTIDTVCISEQSLACMNSVKQLDIGDAIRLLENVEQYPHINLPPVKPKAGEVYSLCPHITRGAR